MWNRVSSLQKTTTAMVKKRNEIAGIAAAAAITVMFLFVIVLAVFARPRPGQWYARGWRRWRNPRHWIGPRPGLRMW